MNQQPEIKELIKTVSQSLEADGLTAGYIQQLSYTWKSLERYLSEHHLSFSRENCIIFLEEIHGISSAKRYANLCPMDKRRKRAVFVLINCAEGLSLYRKKNYWPYDFGESYATIFSDFLNERKSHNFALSTINRDIYTLNHFSKYLQLSKVSDISSISPQIVQGFIKWLAIDKDLPTLKSVTSTMRQLLRYLHRKGILSDDYSSTIPTVRCRKIVPTVYGKTEIEAMLSSFNRTSAVGVRNYAMVLMAVRLGMRASDICGLEFKNIHWEKSTIEFVTQKTGKSTVLPLTADVGNAVIKYLTVDGIKAVLGIVDASTKQGVRDLALLSVMYDSAARVQEIADLCINDFRIEKPSILHLTGKGQKTRIIPLMDNTAALLIKYINLFHPHHKGAMGLPLFSNRNGKKLTRAGISYILSKYVDLARQKHPSLIPKTVSPHGLRHSKSMHMLQAGVPLIYIRDFLGHSEISTTEIYARCDSEQKRKAIEAVCPNITKADVPL